MYRKRLRSATGCLRCRQRRAKCDEQHPRCSYCQKWNLTCKWPPLATRNDETISNVARTDLCIATATRPEAIRISPPRQSLIGPPIFDHFGQLTFPMAGERPAVGHLDEFLCSRMVSTYMPFDVALDLKAWAAGLLGWTMCDDALYSAFVAWCASVQREQIGGVVSSHRQLELDIRTVSILRQRIESGRRPTETTILAATYHFLKMLEDSSTDVLQGIARGIYKLLESRGDFQLFSREAHIWTVLSLWGFDSFISILDVQSPSLLPGHELHPPPSFAELYHPNSLAKDLHDHLNSDVMEAIEHMRFFLYFKLPSRQSRPFTTPESFYLIQTSIVFDLRLGQLQTRYIHQKSISEVIVLSMILAKIMLLGGTLRHPLLISNLLHRLSEAISFTDLEGYTAHQMVTLWACFVAMAGSELSTTRASFSQPAFSVLTRMYGNRPWPVQWKDEIHRDIESFIWHSEFDVWFPQTCDVIENHASVE